MGDKEQSASKLYEIINSQLLNNDYSFSYEPPVQGSGGNLDPIWWTPAEPLTFKQDQEIRREIARRAISIVRGDKRVAGATFQTVTLSFEGVDTEVIWFDGEPLADVLERLAQALR